MQREAVTEELANASFEFFYWYSRFEYVIKEMRLLKTNAPGAAAMPDWDKFVANWHNGYEPSEDAVRLVAMRPKRQVVGENLTLSWKEIGNDHCNNGLCKVVAALRTIRNNLFHGGKAGDASVDDVNRNISLLVLGKQVLDQLAVFAGYESDYKRYY